MIAIASYISVRVCVNSYFLTYNLNAKKKMQYTIVSKSKLPLEIASQIYYCDVQFVMEVILRIEDCSFGIWKRLLEILVDQSVIYQRLFLIWNMEVMNILHFYKYKIMNNNKKHCFSHPHTEKVILHRFKDTYKFQNYVTAAYLVTVNE